MVEEHNMEDEGSALAAELVLGLLEGEGKAAALRRQMSDPAFAAEVDRWQARLDPMYHEFPEVQPDARIWDDIERKLDGEGQPVAANPAANDNDAALKRWRLGALVSGGIAACLALVLVLGPSPVEPGPAAGPQIAVAQLTGPIDGLVLAISYNRDTAEMRVDVEGMPETETEPEIWIRAEDGTVRSLGQIGRDGVSEMVLAQNDRTLLTGNAQLFLTMEPASETPHETPSGEPVATGKISYI